jgi:hypothetical protein
MKNSNQDPTNKPVTNKQNQQSGSTPVTKGVYSDNERSKNYKYGADNPQGPDFDKESENSDGDTGQNAGVFK